MIKQIVASLIITLMLSACSFTEFGKNLDAGKQAMKNEYYRAALHYFELSKIDRPNDPDVNTLIETTKTKIQDSLKLMKDPKPGGGVVEDNQSITWLERRQIILHELSIRESGVDQYGKTFEQYVTDAELDQTGANKLDYNALYIEWRKNYINN